MQRVPFKNDNITTWDMYSILSILNMDGLDVCVLGLRTPSLTLCDNEALEIMVTV